MREQILELNLRLDRSLQEETAKKIASKLKEFDEVYAHSVQYGIDSMTVTIMAHDVDKISVSVHEAIADCNPLRGG